MSPLRITGKHKTASEIIKHGLISNADYWSAVLNFDPQTLEGLDTLIRDSVVIKNEVVKQDPTEKGLRKVLNFGHTLGHAIETYSLESDSMEDLLHGEAIAIGLVMETFLSRERFAFPDEELQKLKSIVKSYYPKVAFDQAAIEEIQGYMLHDKKNVKGQVNFVLLSNIGQPEFDQIVDNDLINKAFEFYMKEM